MILKNPEGHQDPITGSKVTTILLKGMILPIGGVASGRVCACSLRSRLVYLGLSPSESQGLHLTQIIDDDDDDDESRHSKCPKV